jgi:hypothetical protein
VGAALAATATLAGAAPPDSLRETGGKPTGPIAIEHEITPTPALGRMLEVAVTITSAVDLDNVVVSFTADESLAFNTATNVQRVAHVASGATYSVTLTVTPLVIDVLDLVVTVEGDSSAGHEVGTLLVPIRLAEQKIRTPAALKADAAGEGRVHSLPAAVGPGPRAL